MWHAFSYDGELKVLGSQLFKILSCRECSRGTKRKSLEVCEVCVFVFCLFVADRPIFQRCVLCFLLQVSELQEKVSKRQILSRSSSEPTTVTRDETSTDHLTDDYQTDTCTNDDAQSQSDTDTQDQSAGRHAVIKNKNDMSEGDAPEGKEMSDKRLEDEDGDNTKNTDGEMLEKEEEHLDALR